MLHDKECEAVKHPGYNQTVCHCASRAFLRDPRYRECLGRDPRISESQWIRYADGMLR